jgi:hypothetical protein
MKRAGSQAAVALGLRGGLVAFGDRAIRLTLTVPKDLSDMLGMFPTTSDNAGIAFRA